jgi:hypothetical protein
MESFYKSQGMTNPIRYRLCIGKEGNPHAPMLLEPSDEDLYEGPDVVKCTCESENKPGLQEIAMIAVKNAMNVKHIESLFWPSIICHLGPVLQICVRVEQHVLNF